MESINVCLFGISLASFIDLNKVAKLINGKQKIYCIRVIEPVVSIGEPEIDGQYDTNLIHDYHFPNERCNIKIGITSQMIKQDDDDNRRDLLYNTSRENASIITVFDTDKIIEKAHISREKYIAAALLS